jgi:hypothetical protein
MKTEELNFQIPENRQQGYQKNNRVQKVLPVVSFHFLNWFVFHSSTILLSVNNAHRMIGAMIFQDWDLYQNKI